MILEIFVLLFCDYSPQIIYQSALQKGKSDSSQSSLRVLLPFFFYVAFACFAFSRRKRSQASASKDRGSGYWPIPNDRPHHVDFDRHIEAFACFPTQESKNWSGFGWFVVHSAKSEELRGLDSFDGSHESVFVRVPIGGVDREFLLWRLHGVDSKEDKAAKERNEWSNDR